MAFSESNRVQIGDQTAVCRKKVRACGIFKVVFEIMSKRGYFFERG
jgi:hypothetical protein